MKLEPGNVLNLLKRCPEYHQSPLVEAEGLAEKLSIHKLWIKDESQRMGLGSFKALGGAYAVARLAEKQADGLKVCCASAGNHGLSVAMGAKIFGLQCCIVLSTQVDQSFASRLEALGANVLRTGDNYEQSMEAALRLAQDDGWTLLSDSSWPGYTQIPTWVMEGYTVSVYEAESVFREQEAWPDFVFLQAGVGGLAAAAHNRMRSAWPVQPEILIVEPDKAACLKASRLAGQLSTVCPGIASNMGRLDCREPSWLAWQELCTLPAQNFLTVSDQQASSARQTLSQAGFETSPSGAAAYAAIEQFELPPESSVFFLISEGSIL